MSFPIRKPIDEEGHVLDIAKDRWRFRHGRKGDYLITHFQCDLCHFRNVQGWDPDPASMKDSQILRCIRRANLDALWSRESSTVEANFRQGKKYIANAEDIGLNLERGVPKLGPFPVKDEVGMFPAIVLLMRTLDPGKNEATIQFETARKMRSFFSNWWRVSLAGAQLDTVASRDKVKLSITSSPTNKDWFEKFVYGMHKRMGDDSRPDLAISVEVMKELMDRYEKDWRAVENGPNKRRDQEWVLFPALFSIVAFCGALRGEEVPLMDLTGTRKHHFEGMRYYDDRYRHTLIALLGRFKTETGEMYHMMPLAEVTESGLRPGIWVERMLDWYAEGGVYHGAVFRNKWGDRASASDYQGSVFAKLEQIQIEMPHLIGPEVTVAEDYGMGRSFRRGSDSRAIAMGVDSTDIDLNNRWRTFEKAKGKTPRLRMQHHYAEVRHILPALLRYSLAM